MLQTLQQQVIDSMKARDAIRVDTLRFLISAVKTVAINKYGVDSDTKLTDADVLDVIKKQVKTHKESVDAFTNAGRSELAEKEAAQLAILESYLPKEITDDELRALLAPVAAAGGDFGPLMGKAMSAAKGQADGARVSAMLKQLLTK
ncbi:GatB/YqeY domain-containing protein [Candidatus Woesebacteria bacterium]|nr:GatB/YqeY domain-containing protein [Candidatus Woesebacteria bacterium]